MSCLLENVKNLEENSPVLGACPGQSGTHKTKLSPGDDGDDGGEEQDTGKTRQQVEEHLGIKPRLTYNTAHLRSIKESLSFEYDI